MKIHELKIDPQYFQMVLDEEKLAEIRFNDRDFKTGDILVLQEYDREQNFYTGRNLHSSVSQIIKTEGLKDGYVLLILRNRIKHFEWLADLLATEFIPVFTDEVKILKILGLIKSRFEFILLCDRFGTIRVPLTALSDLEYSLIDLLSDEIGLDRINELFGKRGFDCYNIKKRKRFLGIF